MTLREVTVRTAAGKFGQEISVGPHGLRADEGPEAGGDDTGPVPHEMVLAGLGACTSMTVKMYADRKGWPLQSVDVRLSGRHEGGVFVIDRRVSLAGPLDDAQRARLLEIAGKCPVAKTLQGSIRIQTEMLPAG
jgi:putative redox protein